MKKLIITLTMIFLMLGALDINNVFAGPPLKPGNPGLPGCLAQVNELEAELAAMEKLAPVPRTGQTTSYAVGDDGTLQEGVPLPTPRFTDNGNGTVTDNLTKLIWLKNANCTDPVGGIDKSSGTLNWGNALTWSNNLASGFCGLTDGSTVGQWRLPNVRELQSLVDYAYSDPAISNSAGTGQCSPGDPFDDLQPYLYWSSTTNAGYSLGAWSVYFSGGLVTSSNKTNYLSVLAVRGGS